MNSKSLTVGGQVRGIAPQSFEDIQRVAKALVAAGLGSSAWNDDPDTKLAKATAQIMTGLELGLPPMQALSNIAIINGRPLIFGAMVPALIHRAGHEYRHWIEGEGDAMKGVAEIVRRQGGEKLTFRSEFSVADAKKAKLWDTRERVKKKGKGGTQYEADNDSPWYRYPKDMLCWRACSRVVKIAAPDVLCGVYVREEFVGRDGMIEGDEPIDITDRVEDVATDVSPRDGGDLPSTRKGRPVANQFNETDGPETFNALQAQIEATTSRPALLALFDEHVHHDLPWGRFPIGWAKNLQDTYHFALRDAVDDEIPEEEEDVVDDSLMEAIDAAQNIDQLNQLWSEMTEDEQEACRSAYMERYEQLEPTML